MIAMNVEGVSEACADFVTGLVQEALNLAKDHPDGFAVRCCADIAGRAEEHIQR